MELEEYIDDSILDEWAGYFRRHYCSDDEMDDLRKGYGYTRQEYLKNIKFPSSEEKLGNAARSGDFCEILVADYLEFFLNYYVPRIRYDRKVNPNSSTQGSDLLGFKVGEKISYSDELVIFEIKAQASETKPKDRLQAAINDSKKDLTRLGFSLNATKQRLREKGMDKDVKIIERFQNATDHPYTQSYGAAAVHSTYSFDETLLENITTKLHPNPDLYLVVIYSKKLMTFIHELYERASIC